MLIVVDYQVDFVDGVFGPVPDAIAIEDAVDQRIAACRERDEPVLFTMDTHAAAGYEDTREGRLFGLHCVEGTEGWNLYGKVRAHQTGATLIRKRAFGSLDLVAHVRALPTPAQITLVGVSTNICVLSNTILLLSAFPEARIVVDSAACAAFTRADHDAALRQLAGLGASIV